MADIIQDIAIFSNLFSSHHKCKKHQYSLNIFGDLLVMIPISFEIKVKDIIVIS